MFKCPRSRDKEQKKPELTWGRVTCDSGGKKEAPTQAPTLSVSLNTDHAMSDSHRRSQPGKQIFPERADLLLSLRQEIFNCLHLHNQKKIILNHLSATMLYLVLFLHWIAGWDRLCDFPPSVSPTRLFRESVQCTVTASVDWGWSEARVWGLQERERSRQRQSVSEYGGIGIWRRLTTWPGDHWGQVGSRDHGGVHIRQPRHSGRGRGWVQDFLWYLRIKMLRGKSDLSKTRLRKSCYGIQKQSVRLKKFTSEIFLIEHLLFSVGWMTVFIICCVAIFLIIAVVLTTLYVISYKQRQKKKHNFGIKKVKSSVCMTRKFLDVHCVSIIVQISYLKTTINHPISEYGGCRRHGGDCKWLIVAIEKVITNKWNVTYRIEQETVKTSFIQTIFIVSHYQR